MTTYDLTQTIPTALAVGDILDCPYSGAEIAITLPNGRYKIECWGASGGNGNNSATYRGGAGGYAHGILTLNADRTVYLYAGGAGTGKAGTGVQAGGFNGGGAGGYYRGGSGGGASDVRVGDNALTSRVIVAGGGGGGAYRSGYYGGAGGGDNGADGTGYSTTYNAKGGTHSGGGAGGSYNGGVYQGEDGSLGQGGAAATATTSNYGRGGGGGGGYYGGGGSGYRASSSYYYYGQSGGGGGSGYIDAALTDAETVAGNESFTDSDGSTVTGHTGDGFARITVLALMPSIPTNFRRTNSGEKTVSLTWDAAQNATGYKLYRGGVLIANQTALTYADTATSYNTTYTYELVAYNGNMEADAAELTVDVGWEGYTLDLVTDRTEADVAECARLCAVGLTAMTAAEKAAFLAGLKGGYCDVDLNRVETAVAYLAAALQSAPEELADYAVALGVAPAEIFTLPYDPEDYDPTVKNDWLVGDIPSPAHMTRYLGNVQHLITAIDAAYPSLPSSMDNLTYGGANAIERALIMLYEALSELKAQIKSMIDNTALAWYYTGDVYAGEI